MKFSFFLLSGLFLFGHGFFAVDSRSEVISQDDFIPVKGGCFEMGDQFGDGLTDEIPVHSVCLSDFHISKYEVTQEQWTRIMGDNPSSDKSNPRYPVDIVSWHEVQRFITRLNSTTGGTFRLPTEAEWEYACRAGGTDIKYSTADGTDASLQAGGQEDGPEIQGIRVVGSLPANALGLYDMSGNVSEWVEDLYDRAFYTKSPVNDPRLTEDPTKRSRVRRGGYWGDNEWVMRCTFRNLRKPNYRLVGLGFRLAKD